MLVQLDQADNTYSRRIIAVNSVDHDMNIIDVVYDLGSSVK